MIESERPITEEYLESHLGNYAGELQGLLAAKLPAYMMSHISPEDLAQEVWISAFKTLPGTILVGENALDRWVRRVAYRKLAAAIRTSRRLKRGGAFRRVEAPQRSSSYEALYQVIAADTKTPSRILAAREAGQAVRLAMAQLQDRHRLVIELFHIERLPAAEVAAKMNTTTIAVKSLLARARRGLRTRLGSASRYFSRSGAMVGKRSAK